MRIWSAQQESIFGWFTEPYLSPNLIVRARAGTGKTTTIVEAVNHAPEEKILLCAFNKKIADELVSRGTRATAKTLHAVGLACVKLYWPDVKVNFQGDRQAALTEDVCGSRTPDTIKGLVSKLHTKGREIAPHATQVGDLTDIQVRFELEPDEEWVSLGFDAVYVEEKALAAMELAAKTKPVLTGIDGSDMIFLPVRNGWLHKSHDMVIVDEAQDMTTAQLEIAVGVCRGRIVVVGDDRQAIYAFRGADSNSLDRLKRELQAEELGLTTTYRCAKSIVRLAATLVPDFQAGPDNPEGEVLDWPVRQMLTEAGPGDFILSRLNAPLIGIAMKLLRAGKRTQVAGRDIGAGLSGLIRKLKARSVPEFLERLAVWEAREVTRLIRARRESMVEMVRDKASMLMELSDDARNVQEIHDRIDRLFTDDGLGAAGVITCSSVHKSKGLEANRVFVLKDTLRTHDQEELNIQYVAITRAKHTLVFVTGIDGQNSRRTA